MSADDKVHRISTRLKKSTQYNMKLVNYSDLVILAVCKKKTVGFFSILLSPHVRSDERLKMRRCPGSKLFFFF